MRRVFSVMLVAAVVLLAGAKSYAHHSYASTYDVRQEVTLKGKLVQFVYRNPHTFVHVQAPDADGQMQRWAVEWGGTTQLDRSGVTRDTLKVGDEVVIVARPSRVQGEYRALMVKLTRPSDGFSWGTRQGEQVD